MRLIGLRCKHGDVFSLQVLIGRGLDLLFFQPNLCKFLLLLPSLCSVLKVLAFFKSVLMAVRFHLFPFRTQKLSSYASKILGWRRPGKIDQCRHFPDKALFFSALSIFSSIAQSVEHAAVNRRVVGSSPTGGAKRSQPA